MDEAIYWMLRAISRRLEIANGHVDHLHRMTRQVEEFEAQAVLAYVTALAERAAAQQSLEQS